MTGRSWRQRKRWKVHKPQPQSNIVWQNVALRNDVFTRTNALQRTNNFACRSSSVDFSCFNTFINSAFLLDFNSNLANFVLTLSWTEIAQSCISINSNNKTIEKKMDFQCFTFFNGRVNIYCVFGNQSVLRNTQFSQH